MSVLKYYRKDVTHYDITKKKVIKGSENDKIKERFTNLPQARRRALQLYRINNLISLKNSNGVSLPI